MSYSSRPDKSRSSAAPLNLAVAQVSTSQAGHPRAYQPVTLACSRIDLHAHSRRDLLARSPLDQHNTSARRLI